MNIILSNRRKYMVARLNPEGAPASIADCVVTLAQNSYEYTGQPITPQVTVTYNGVTLVVNTDYTVSYADNTNVGAGTVTVTAKEGSEYVGSQVKTFQITSAAPAPTVDWDFDITKTEYVNGKSMGSSQNQVVAGCYEIKNSASEITGIGLATTNWLSGCFGRINIINKDDSNSYHIINAGEASSVSPGAGGDYLTLVGISKDGKNVYWTTYTGSSYSIRQQKLSTPGDFSSIESTVDSQVLCSSRIKSISFSSDGTKLFTTNMENVQGFYKVVVSCIPLLTPFDVSTANVSSITTKTLTDSALNNFDAGYLEVSPDGKVIVISFSYYSSHKIAKFLMSTSYDINTLILDGIYVCDRENNGLAISPDAKSLFSAVSSGKVHEYALKKKTGSWNFDITKTTYTGDVSGAIGNYSFRYSTWNNKITSGELSGKSQIQVALNNSIKTFVTGTDFSASGLTSYREITIPTGGVYINRATWSSDGLKLLATDLSTNTGIFVFSITTPFSWDEIESSTSVHYERCIYTNYSASFCMNQDGTYFVITENAGVSAKEGWNVAYSFRLTTPYDFSTIDSSSAQHHTFPGFIDSGEEAGLTYRNLTISPDGKTVILLFSQKIVMYSLATPWDLSSTKTKLGSCYISNLISGAGEFDAIYINETADKMLLRSSNTGLFYGLNLFE